MSRSILILGDSIVKEVKTAVPEDVSVISLSGYTINKLRPVALQCAPFFSTVVLHVGTNDIPGKRTVKVGLRIQGLILLFMFCINSSRPATTLVKVGLNLCLPIPYVA
jgi:hypothetical protein